MTSAPHGTPTARSMPWQLESVWPGSQGTHCPLPAEPHVASHALCTRSTQLCDQVFGAMPVETFGPSQTAPCELLHDSSPQCASLAVPEATSIEVQSWLLPP